MTKDDKVVFKKINEYNEKNLKTRQVEYNDNDEISSISLYEYDVNGNRILYKLVKENGELLNQWKTIYNTKNQKTEVYSFGKKSFSFYLRYKYNYNINNKYSSFESYDNQGKLAETSEYIYENGNLAKIVIKRNGKSDRIISYKYNKKGLLIEERYYGKKTHRIINGKEYIFKKWKNKATYDNENNLISKISSGNGIKFNIQKYFYKKHK